MTAGFARSLHELPPAGDPVDERAFLRRVRGGEPAAIGRVYDLYAGDVRAFARRLVGDAAAAEDLVHEVFLTLPSVIGRYEEGASLKAFLTSIAINHARHHVRSAARRRRSLDAFAAEVTVRGDDPERDASRGELARALSLALDRLPLAQRAAFVLCEVEERTAAEAARVLGVPEATVRTRVFHARRKLREALSRGGER